MSPIKISGVTPDENAFLMPPSQAITYAPPEIRASYMKAVENHNNRIHALKLQQQAQKDKERRASNTAALMLMLIVIMLICVVGVFITIIFRLVNF